MKKIILILLLGFSPLICQAQGGIGLKGGLNYAALSGAVNLESKFKTDLMVGAFWEIPVNENIFHFQPEIVYSRQGAQEGQAQGGGSGTFLNLNYINFPVIGKFYIGDQFSFQIGPQMGLLLSANRKVNGVVLDENLKEIFEPLSFAAVGGLGYDLKDQWRISARANIDIFNIGKELYNQTSGDDIPSIRNIVIQLGVGYQF